MKWSVNAGRDREVAEQVEDPLARDVDRDASPRRAASGGDSMSTRDREPPRPAISVQRMRRMLRHCGASSLAMITEAGRSTTMLIDGSPIATAATEIHRSGEQITEAQPGRCTASTAGSRSRSASLELAAPSARTATASSFRRALDFEPPADGRGAAARGRRRATASGSTRSAPSSIEPGQYLAFDDGDGEYARDPPRARLDADRALAEPPTSASTTPPSRAATRSSCSPRAASCGRSTTAASTASSSTASGSSGRALSDGDELEIGRYRLYMLEA